MKTKREDRLKKAYEDIAAGRCVCVEHGSKEYHQLFNKLEQPKTKHDSPKPKAEKIRRCAVKSMVL